MIDKDIKSDFCFSNSKEASSDFLNKTPCAHRLPCGVCELTNKKCPLDGWYENPIVWTSNINGGIKND